jgi:hypothetical protein
MGLILKHKRKLWKILTSMIFKYNLKNKNNYIDLTGYSPVGRAIDCRSIGHLFDSGCSDVSNLAFEKTW